MSAVNPGIVKRLSSEKYLKSTFVLAIDLFVSLVASGVVVLFADLLELGGTGSSDFTITWFVAAFVGSLFGFLSTSSYEGVIRHSTLRELTSLCEAAFEKEIIILLGLAIFILPDISPKVFWILPAIDLLVTVSLLVVVRVSMVVLYDFLTGHLRLKPAPGAPMQRVLVYGIAEKAIALSTRFVNSTHFDILGYITPAGSTGIKQLNGKPVYTFSDLADLADLKEKLHLQGIIFPIPNDVRREANGLVEQGRQLNIRLYVVPSVDEVDADSEQKKLGMRDIRIEDLLWREEIEISLDEVRAELDGKTVLVTGAAGSIGSELCRQLANLGVERIIMFDNAETPLHYLRLEFDDRYKWVKTVPVIGDVRSEKRVDFVFRKYKPDMVFHAAAYKHVPLMEENPCEAVLVNVMGSRTVAKKCVEYGVGKMVMVSTDKAVNPTNIMGCTKRLAEIYVQSLGLALENGLMEGKTQFVTTRFGNVLGSNGSVIPRFKEQIAAGGPVTVTHPEIRRFFMTIPEACRLVLEAATLATGTQIFAFDMGQPVKIADLAARMIRLAGFEPDKDIKIVYSGLRPGEKLYEEVLADKENTTPTTHKRIFKAKVREYHLKEVEPVMDNLVELAVKVEINPMVKLMKATVPEFISNHSEFSAFDNPIHQH